MPKKNYFSKKHYKKNKNILKKFLIVILSLSSLVCFIVIVFFLTLYLNTIDINSIIAIKKITIVKNKTTIPSDLITKKIFEEKINFLNLNNKKLKIIKMFPEIKRINFKFKSFKNYLVEIIEQKPVFVIHNNKQKIFYASDGTKFWVYDFTKINFEDIIELTNEKYVDKDFLSNLYKYFTDTGKNNLIKKIYFKHNNEIIIETLLGNKIIVDEQILKIDHKLFAKTFEISEEENLDIYARDLGAGKLYVKSKK